MILNFGNFKGLVTLSIHNILKYTYVDFWPKLISTQNYKPSQTDVKETSSLKVTFSLHTGA